MTNNLVTAATAAGTNQTPTWLPVVQFIAQLIIGGGLVVAIFNSVREARSERRRRRVEYLQKQLGELYGPLHFFAKQNQELIKLHNQHGEAYEKEFIETKWSGAWLKDESGKSEPEKAIDVRNEYAEAIRVNHGRMMEILEKNWGLVDAEDLDTFSQFMVDQARSRIEFDEKRVLKTPLGIFHRIGDGTAYTYRSTFVDRIHRQWESKQSQLRTLAGFLSKSKLDPI